MSDQINRPCKHCDSNLDGGSILDTFKLHRDQELEYLRDKTDEELQKIMEEHYSPPYRWGREMGYVQNDRIVEIRCPDCGGVL